MGPFRKRARAGLRHTRASGSAALITQVQRRASRAGARPLGRARGLGALGHGLDGALGLELGAAALAVGGLGGGDLGLVRAHVGAHRVVEGVDVRLKGGVEGGVGDEVPAAPLVDARHERAVHG